MPSEQEMCPSGCPISAALPVVESSFERRSSGGAEEMWSMRNFGFEHDRLDTNTYILNGLSVNQRAGLLYSGVQKKIVFTFGCSYMLVQLSFFISNFS